MKIFQTYCNTSALLPSVLYFVFCLSLALTFHFGIYYLIKPSFTIIEITLIIFLIFCLQVNKLKRKITILLLNFFITVKGNFDKLIDFIEERPFFLCYCSLFLSIGTIGYFIFQVTKIIFDFELNSKNTIAITTLATFIPFAFAGFTYAKSRLSTISSAKITESCFDSNFFYMVILLSLIYLISIISPLLFLPESKSKQFQLALIALCFLSTGTFILAVIKISNRDNALKYFRIIEEKKLRKLFLKDCPHLPISKLLFTHNIRFYVTGIGSQTYNEIIHPLTPDEDCFEAANSVNYAFSSTLNEYIAKKQPVNEIATCMNEWSKYLENYYLFREHYADTSSDKVNEFVIPELKKTMEIVASEENEKYLESFIVPFRRITLAACRHRGIGMSDESNGNTFRWIRFIKETTVRSANLQNTAYPNQIIDLLGDIACEDLKQKHRVSFHIEEIASLSFVFFQSTWFWHHIIAGNCIEQLNKIFPCYIETWLEKPSNSDFFLRTWQESYFKILEAGIKTLPEKNLLASNPIASTYNTLRRNDDKTLPWAYFHSSNKLGNDAIKKLEKILPKDAHIMAEKQIWKMKTKSLIVHDIFNRLLSSKELFEENLSWKEAVGGLVAIFFTDLLNSKKISNEFIQNWHNECIEHYKKIFKTYAKQIQFEMNTKTHHYLWQESFESFMGIPAIALTLANESNNGFVDNIIDICADFFCDLISENSSQNNNNDFDCVKSNALLLAGWLKVTDKCKQSRTKIEKILMKKPYVISTYSGLIIPISSYSMYGFPGSHLGFDDEWWLFPCTFWEGTNLQDKVKDTLMKIDELVEYAKEIVIFDENQNHILNY